MSLYFIHSHSFILFTAESVFLARTAFYIHSYHYILFTAVCPGGQEYMEATDECALCPVGKYKPDNDRFGMCSSCTEGFITDGKGKMSLDDCIIRKYCM